MALYEKRTSLTLQRLSCIVDSAPFHQSLFISPRFRFFLLLLYLKLWDPLKVTPSAHFMNSTKHFKYDAHYLNVYIVYFAYVLKHFMNYFCLQLSLDSSWHYLKSLILSFEFLIKPIKIKWLVKTATNKEGINQCFNFANSAISISINVAK